MVQDAFIFCFGKVERRCNTQFDCVKQPKQSESMNDFKQPLTFKVIFSFRLKPYCLGEFKVIQNIHLKISV